MRRRHFNPKKYKKDNAWSDDQWVEILTEITKRRKKTGDAAEVLRIGQLVGAVKEIAVEQNPDEDKEMIVFQVKNTFQDRDWTSPAILGILSQDLSTQYARQTESVAAASLGRRKACAIVKRPE